MEYELTAPADTENGLFYRLDGEIAERHGAIGYLRVDFGRSGQEFWATWTDNRKHLKTPAFKDSFNLLVNNLRNELFEDRVSMRLWASGIYGISLGERGTGFKLHTTDYTYYLRCNPGQPDYDAYMFAYDNRYLLPELAGKHELPNDCFGILPSTGELVFIVLGEKGYYPSGKSTDDPEINRQIEVASNTLLGVTRQQAEAMLGGSLSGWNTPAAKPWNYDLNGRPRTLPNKEKERDYER